MTAPRDSGGGAIRPVVALAFAVIGFVTLAIFGLGMTSLAVNADVIPVRGLGPVPGVLGMLLATAAFAGVTWWGLRGQHPSFGVAPIVGLAAYLGEPLGIVVGAVSTGADLAAALSAAGAVAAGWAGAVIAGAALVAALGGIALVRTRADRPQWPWERDEPED